MDREKALRILKTLADGIDPGTGEALPAASAYQHPDAVRALFVAIRALESPEASEAAAKRGTPAARPGVGNAGKPWSKEEDEQLLAAFDGGQPVEAIAQVHGRSKVAIEARLAKFGRVPMPAGIRGNSASPHAAEPRARYAAQA
ncbi:MAG: SANT/Myb-like DNA-binding domain-containing protein [Burkholderiales bacterium]|jgi:hypothetical protein|nr:SANT/Myb-like DNA-binding domain-containing protein [Burkholderiales bacterium]